MLRSDFPFLTQRVNFANGKDSLFKFIPFCSTFNQSQKRTISLNLIIFLLNDDKLWISWIKDKKENPQISDSERVKKNFKEKFTPNHIPHCLQVYFKIIPIDNIYTLKIRSYESEFLECQQAIYRLLFLGYYDMVSPYIHGSILSHKEIIDHVLAKDKTTTKALEICEYFHLDELYDLSIDYFPRSFPLLSSFVQRQILEKKWTILECVERFTCEEAHSYEEFFIHIKNKLKMHGKNERFPIQFFFIWLNNLRDEWKFQKNCCNVSMDERNVQLSNLFELLKQYKYLLPVPTTNNPLFYSSNGSFKHTIQDCINAIHKDLQNTFFYCFASFCMS